MALKMDIFDFFQIRLKLNLLDFATLFGMAIWYQGGGLADAG